MAEQFVSERLKPVAESVDFSETPVGEPPLPRRFVWREVEYAVDEVLRTWKESGRDKTHGSSEQYVRKHWFHVRTTSGHEMKIYFERHAKSKAQRTSRWWVFTVEAPGSAGAPDSA